MRMALALLLLVAIVAAASAELPKQVDPQPVIGKLKGEWRQIDLRIPKEKQLRESFGLQWSLYKPADPGAPLNQGCLTDHDNESTQTVGLLLLNTDANPMWLDFRFPDGAGDFVQVGILRFEEGQPRWVLNKEWVPLAKWESARGKVSERPTKFEDAQGQPLGCRLEPFTFGSR